jgi:hypothetical protein
MQPNAFWKRKYFLRFCENAGVVVAN